MLLLLQDSDTDIDIAIDIDEQYKQCQDMITKLKKAIEQRVERTDPDPWKSYRDYRQQIESFWVTSSLVNSVNNRRQEREKKELEELTKRYLEKEQYIKANKPSIRRMNNINKFRYHQQLPKLSKNYRMNTKYKYNRW